MRRERHPQHWVILWVQRATQKAQRSLLRVIAIQPAEHEVVAPIINSRGGPSSPGSCSMADCVRAVAVAAGSRRGNLQTKHLVPVRKLSNRPLIELNMG